MQVDDSRRRGVHSHGPSSFSLQSQKTGIQEDEMTTTLTASRPAAAGTGTPPKAGPPRCPRVTLIVGIVAVSGARIAASLLPSRSASHPELAGPALIPTKGMAA
jgi:hypothetical protein